MRKKNAERVRQLFSEKDFGFFVFHWDGRIMPDWEGKKLDRVPILVSHGKTVKLLGVPSLTDGKGITQARAINSALLDWGLSDKIIALACDTTGSNLGCSKGAAILLEELMDKKLMYLPCRHHIYELIITGVYNHIFPGTTGPEVTLFNQFQAAWIRNEIDLSKFRSGLAGLRVPKLLQDKVAEMDLKIQELKKTIMPRDDYKELLLLSQIFLGVLPVDSVPTFYKPGATSHARFLSKAIYCLKIFILRDTFKLETLMKKKLLDICLFIVFVYIKFWYTSPLAAASPNNDLDLIKELCKYESVNKNIAEVALLKISHHLWYLTPEKVALSLFDKNVSIIVKKN